MPVEGHNAVKETTDMENGRRPLGATVIDVNAALARLERPSDPQ